MIDYVYYPCAGYDGSAVKIFGRDIQLYVYVDAVYEKCEILNNIREEGFFGYEKSKYTRSNNIIRTLKSFDELVSIHSFVRLDGYTQIHGPDTFTIVFLRGDGIEILKRLFHQLGKPPSAIIYIRPGLAFGGNRDSYPSELEILIGEIKSVKYIAADWGLTEGGLGDMPHVRETYSVVDCTHTCNTQCEEDLKIRVLKKPGT